MGGIAELKGGGGSENVRGGSIRAIFLAKAERKLDRKIARKAHTQRRALK